jgi:peroxiredoxin
VSHTQNNWKLGLVLSVVAVLALAAGYGLRTFLHDRARADAAEKTTIIGQPRPDFSLPDLEGSPHPISEWDGKVLLINFWATWCPPCKREIPDFIKVREQIGAEQFEVIGIAIDNPKDISDFVKAQGIPYPILHGEGDASQISQAYGNSLGGLPYSVLVDRQGIIRSSKTGEFKPRDLLKQLQPLLQQENHNKD